MLGISQGLRLQFLVICIIRPSSLKGHYNGARTTHSNSIYERRYCTLLSQLDDSRPTHELSTHEPSRPPLPLPSLSAAWPDETLA